MKKYIIPITIVILLTIFYLFPNAKKHLEKKQAKEVKQLDIEEITVDNVTPDIFKRSKIIASLIYSILHREDLESTKEGHFNYYKELPYYRHYQFPNENPIDYDKVLNIMIENKDIIREVQLMFYKLYQKDFTICFNPIKSDYKKEQIYNAFKDVVNFQIITVPRYSTKKTLRGWIRIEKTHDLEKIKTLSDYYRLWFSQSENLQFKKKSHNQEIDFSQGGSFTITYDDFLSEYSY